MNEIKIDHLSIALLLELIAGVMMLIIPALLYVSMFITSIAVVILLFTDIDIRIKF